MRLFLCFLAAVLRQLDYNTTTNYVCQALFYSFWGYFFNLLHLSPKPCFYACFMYINHCLSPKNGHSYHAMPASVTKSNSLSFFSTLYCYIIMIPNECFWTSFDTFLRFTSVIRRERTCSNHSHLSLQSKFSTLPWHSFIPFGILKLWILILYP